MRKFTKDKSLYLILAAVFLLQLLVIFSFCLKKTGFHYDEYYSYYSSNVTYGLVPTDRDWKSAEEIRNEFQVLPGEEFNFSTVVRMQTYDVHPPFYYLLLHAVCSLTPGIFSKWSALSLNILFFAASFWILAAITKELAATILKACGRSGQKEIHMTTILVCLLYGFSPAVISGIMMSRMYTLLTLLVLLITLLHINALKSRKRNLKFFIPTILCVYLGFLTHYYYAVFTFFLAAFMEFYLLFETAEHKSWGQKWKDCLGYGFSIVGAMIAAVLSYPSCLGHIFRGYRGTEAMGEFFNIQNTSGRFRFFVGLLNEYVFGSMLPLIALVLVLLFLTFCTKKPMKPKTDSQPENHVPLLEKYRLLWIPALSAAGYFLVVAKTALLNAEEANRYPLPVYGLILMFTMLSAVLLFEKCFPNFSFRKKYAVLTLLFLLLFSGEIAGLAENKVLFLYEDDAENIAFAQENSDVPVVYLYNQNLMWMIWDESLELMQYEEIYFVNKNDLSPISDQKLADADRVLVYVARGDDAQTALDIAQNAVGEQVQTRLLRELLYCDLYEVKKQTD